MHKELKPGIIKKIVRDADITIEDLMDLLK